MCILCVRVKINKCSFEPFCVWIMSGCSHAVACDIFGTFAVHATLVCDVIDTDCRVQHGSTHGHVFTILKR